MTSTDIEGGKGSLAFPEEQAPAAVSKTAPKNKKWILAALATLALIGLVVGLSVGLTRNNNDNSTGGTANEDTGGSTVTSQFTETKSFMDAVCSDDDKTVCEEKCKVVDCCNPFDKDNCLAENADKCFEYAMCHVVKEAQKQGAPSNLTDICAMEELEECAKVCEKVKCCYDETDNCQDTQFLTCLDYAPCQVLNKKATVKPAPADLLTTCMDGGSKCEDACAKASCCWDTDENCLQTDFMTCLTYAPCGSLLLNLPNTIVDRPLETFLGDCSIDSVLTDEGYNVCKDECEEAKCCTATDDSNCFLEDPIGCMQHLQCGLLAFAGGDVVKADTDKLKEECDLQAVLDGGSFSDECKDACNNATCCVSQEDNCLADGNALACMTYLPCLPVLALGETGLDDLFSGTNLPDLGDLFPGLGGDGDGGFPLFGEGTIGSPPDELKDACSRDDLGTCEKLCKDVECCTSTGDDNCLLENLIMCATWNLQGCFAVNNFQLT